MFTSFHLPKLDQPKILGLERCFMIILPRFNVGTDLSLLRKKAEYGCVV